MLRIALLSALLVQTPDSVRLATFDTVWAVVQRMHFDSTFGGIDWPAVRTELRPKAAAAKDDRELRTVLAEMIGRLGQSHYAIFPQDAQDTRGLSNGQGDLGMDVRYVENNIVVTRVEPDGPAARAGVKPGWIVQNIDGRPIATVLATARDLAKRYAEQVKLALVARAALSGPEDSTVKLQLTNERGRTVEVALKRRPDPGEPVEVIQLPPFFTRFASDTLHYEGLKVGRIWFNVWMGRVLARFDSAVDRSRDAQGIIIDLRGNPGGVGGLSMGVAGHFLDTAQVFGTMQTRTTRLQFKANPRRVNTRGERVTPYQGPVAVLIDELSGSTSEVFTGGLQSIRRVRVFGHRSLGAVLPATTRKLPNGDVLYHAFADFRTADGTLLEGRGVIPDEQVIVKRADLLAGRDPVLEAALRWIAAEARARNSTFGDGR